MTDAQAIAADLEKIRAAGPLVHNITNYVVMNTTANALLALGASPVMAHAVEEVEEMAGLAAALVLNIGTLSGPWIEAMKIAARAARKKGIPIVLDPVGAGATRFRTAAALDSSSRGPAGGRSGQRLGDPGAGHGRSRDARESTAGTVRWKPWGRPGNWPPCGMRSSASAAPSI